MSGTDLAGAAQLSWRAEWIKLRTVPSTVGWLAGTVGLTVLITAFMCAVAHTDAMLPGQGDDDLVVNSLRGVYLGQVAVIGYAVSTAVSEYGTGLVAVTFLALPRRRVALLAHAAVVTIAVFTAGLAAAVVSFLVGQPLLRAGGFAPPAYPVAALTDPTSIRAILGTAVLLAALGLLGLSVGVLLRRTAPAVALVSGLVLAPLVLGGFLPESMARSLSAWTPIAGYAVQSTPGVGESWPVGPWAGLAVTVAWALAALAAALWVVGGRDA